MECSKSFTGSAPSPSLLELSIYLRVLGPQGMFLALIFTDRKQTWGGGLYQGAHEKGPSYYIPLVLLQTNPQRTPILFDINSGRISPQGHSVICPRTTSFWHILLSRTLPVVCISKRTCFPNMKHSNIKCSFSKYMGPSPQTKAS